MALQWLGWMRVEYRVRFTMDSPSQHSALNAPPVPSRLLWVIDLYTVCVKDRPEGDTITESTKAEYNGAVEAFCWEFVSLLSICALLACVYYVYRKASPPYHKLYTLTNCLKVVAITGVVVAYSWHISTLPALRQIYDDHSVFIRYIPVTHLTLALTAACISVFPWVTLA